MGYPDTFEGFVIDSHDNWSDFKKQEVGPTVSFLNLNVVLTTTVVQGQAVRRIRH
jgi:hypothetical protein